MPLNLCMEPLCATILVLVVTSRNIILAADSKKTYLYPDGPADGGTMEKIHQSGTFYYASSGLYEDGSFNMRAIIHNVFCRYPDFTTAFTNIAATLATALKEYFVNLKKSNPKAFAQYLQHSGAGGEIFIVTRYKNIPSAAIIDYSIKDSASAGIVLNTWSIDTIKIKSAGECFWRTAGNTSFTGRLVPSEKELAEQPVDGARKIIEDGIKANPSLVSTPIVVLEMAKSGERFYTY
jgi:hypothetical protein